MKNKLTETISLPLSMVAQSLSSETLITDPFGDLVLQLEPDVNPLAILEALNNYQAMSEGLAAARVTILREVLSRVENDSEVSLQDIGMCESTSIIEKMIKECEPKPCNLRETFQAFDRGNKL